MSASKKSVNLKVAAATLALTPLIFLYTNMGAKYIPRSKTQIAVEDSKKVLLQMNKFKGRNDKVYNILRNHKLAIDNIVAARSFSKNCRDLLTVNSSTETGTYMLFVNGKSDAPAPVKCTITNGHIVAEQVLTKNE